METRQLRAEGVDLRTFAVTRRSLIAFTVFTAALWILAAVLSVAGEPALPLLPILCSVWLAVQIRSHRAQLHSEIGSGTKL